MSRKPGPWPEWTDSPPGPPPPKRVNGEALRVTFVNHSTVLIQMGGMNILTDPVWSERASPVSWAGPRRHRPPGLRMEHLPPIDAILLSHNHYDHLDLASISRLSREHHPRVIVPLANRECLESRQLKVTAELDWWQGIELDGGPSGSSPLRITSVPARHFSGRGLRDRNAALWSGYVLESASSTVYFAGDTGYGEHFVQVRERFRPIRLALLPIGAFRPQWFMSPYHMSPEEAVDAHQVLDAATSLAIHFGTFRLADDGQEEPAARLRKALDRANIPPSRFWILGCGEGRDVPESVGRPTGPAGEAIEV